MTAAMAQDLARLRKEVQRIDADLVSLLAERMSVVREIGQLKRASAMPIADPAREAAVVSHAARCARGEGLPENEVRELFWKIVALSRSEQHP